MRQIKCQNGKHPKEILLVLSVINARETLGLMKIKLERLHNVFMTIVRISILKEFNELFGWNEEELDTFLEVGKDHTDHA